MVGNSSLFLATKIEAFLGRGKGDFLSSHDIEDMISIPRILAEAEKIEDLKSENNTIQAIAQGMDPGDVDFLKATSFRRTVKELQLDKKIGHTYKALSAAVS